MNPNLLGAGLLSASMLLVGAIAVAGDRGTTARDVAPVTDPSYAAECGACHFAYPPGLLPARSWKKLMAGLDDHFGENAQLSPGDRKAITEYLVYNAADHGPGKRSAKIARSIGPDETPIRISETPYIAREHREIPARLVTGNPRVGSLANCNACHTQAAKGSFDEREIHLPGHGRWRD